MPRRKTRLLDVVRARPCRERQGEVQDLSGERRRPVSEEHLENIYAIDREVAGDIHETAQRVALAMKAAFGCDGISTRQHNEPGAMQEVWHYHLHVFPRWEGDDLYGSTARLSAPEERVPYASALRQAIAETV